MRLKNVMKEYKKAVCASRGFYGYIGGIMSALVSIVIFEKLKSRK